MFKFLKRKIKKIEEEIKKEEEESKKKGLFGISEKKLDEILWDFEIGLMEANVA